MDTAINSSGPFFSFLEINLKDMPKLTKPRGRTSVAVAISLFFFRDQPEVPTDFGLHIIEKFP